MSESEVELEPEVLSSIGDELKSVARQMPDGEWGPSCDCGANQANDQLDLVTAQACELLLGAGTELFALGQQAINAADAFVLTDEGL